MTLLDRKAQKLPESASMLAHEAVDSANERPGGQHRVRGAIRVVRGASIVQSRNCR